MRPVKEEVKVTARRAIDGNPEKQNLKQSTENNAV